MSKKRGIKERGRVLKTRQRSIKTRPRSFIPLFLLISYMSDYNMSILKILNKKA